MTKTNLPPAVRAVLASSTFRTGQVEAQRVNVVGGPQATLVTQRSEGEKPRHALYDDFGQLKATLPSAYDSLPTLAFVGKGDLPGSNGITVEIIGEPASSPLRQLIGTLTSQMRPAFAADFEAQVSGFGDGQGAIVRDYGVLRNLAGGILEKYGSNLSTAEASALQEFQAACAQKATGWSFGGDTRKLLPSMSVDFPSLSSPQ